MSVHAVFAAVKIRYRLFQIAEISRLFYIRADCENQPDRRIRINIRFQIGIPSQHGMPVGILMGNTFVDRLFCEIDIKIKHSHPQLRVVAYGFFTEHAKGYLLFRPKIIYMIKLRIRTLGTQFAETIFRRHRIVNNSTTGGNQLVRTRNQFFFRIDQTQYVINGFTFSRQQMQAIL